MYMTTLLDSVLSDAGMVLILPPPLPPSATTVLQVIVVSIVRLVKSVLHSNLPEGTVNTFRSGAIGS